MDGKHLGRVGTMTDEHLLLRRVVTSVTLPDAELKELLVELLKARGYMPAEILDGDVYLLDESGDVLPSSGIMLRWTEAGRGPRNG